jgi:hypothetical protein
VISTIFSGMQVAQHVLGVRTVDDLRQMLAAASIG